jgi:hypothetical protein
MGIGCDSFALHDVAWSVIHRLARQNGSWLVSYEWLVRNIYSLLGVTYTWSRSYHYSNITGESSVAEETTWFNLLASVRGSRSMSCNM